MQFHQLQRKNPNMKRMIVARGGKRGKTAGRGGKGQSARAGNKRRPEWRDIIKKLPKLRGRGVNQNKPVTETHVVVNLAVLEGAFAANEAITPTILVEKGIVSTWSGNIPDIKILGDGEVTKAFKVSGCAISESAKTKIEKAGGTVTALASRVVTKNKGPSSPTDVNTAPKKEEGKKEKGKETKIKKDKAPAKEKAEKSDAPKAEKNPPAGGKPAKKAE